MSDRPAFGSEPLTAAELRAQEKELRAQEKKARRKQRRDAERAGARELDALAEVAVEQALALAPEVADAPSREASERGLDLIVPSVDAATYLRRRINEVLAAGEWLDDVEVWVWQRDQHVRPPLTPSGQACGIEVRLERARRL